MRLTDEQKRIERMYQRAMNLRDSSRCSIDFEPIENEYSVQYRKAFRRGLADIFTGQTREYRALLNAYRTR